MIVGVAKQQVSSALHEHAVDTSTLEGTSSDMAISVALDTVDTVIEVASPPKTTPIMNSITITSPDSVLKIEKTDFIDVNNF